MRDWFQASREHESITMKTNLSLPAPSLSSLDETQTVAPKGSRITVERGEGIHIPENVEEIIDAYVAREFARVGRPGAQFILSNYYDNGPRQRLACFNGKTFSADTLVEAASKLSDYLVTHDPLAEKKAAREKLDAEIAALEGRGE